MKLMNLLLTKFQPNNKGIRLYHKDIDTGEINGSNLCVVLYYLHDNFSRRKIRKILKEGSFKLL
jgi:hypothetical protein